MEFVIQKGERKTKRTMKNITNTKSVMHLHSEKIEYFENLQNVVLPEKEKLYKETGNKNLLKEINDIKNRKEETEYYLDSAHLLSEYIEIEENFIKSDIFSKAKLIKETNDKKHSIIIDYYKIVKEERPVIFYNKLMIKDADLCKNCKSEIIESSEGNVCENCGLFDNFVFLETDMSYKDKQDRDSKIVIDYKRINYFIEWLNQIQAKEHTVIPENLIDSVILELKKEKITDMKKLNNSMIKRILKKCNFSKYYEHIPLIISSLNGIPPLKIPEPIENKLKFMFNEIQIPWQKHKPKDRSNFFSYPYTLYKFCQILDINEFLPYLTLLKSREKLYNQDIIWKKVINELQGKNKDKVIYDIPWRFIPSV
jgi:hypothetical protein